MPGKQVEEKPQVLHTFIASVMRSRYTNSFGAAAVLLATCADAARPELLPQLNSSKSGKGGRVRNFSIRARGKGRSSDVVETFEFVPDKCMQAGSDAIRIDSKPPYYEDVSLRECAQSCVDDFPGVCVGINYYVNDVPTYPRGHTYVRAHYRGDCFLASSTGVSDCNEQNSGNVRFFAISEADLVGMDVDEMALI